MIAKLTEEQRQALLANPERPLRVEDEQTRRISSRGRRCPADVVAGLH